MPSDMFHYDPAMTDLIIARLPGAACPWTRSPSTSAAWSSSLDAELAGLMRPEGQRRRRGPATLHRQAGHRRRVVRQPALPVVHPGRAHQGLTPLRHVRVVLVAARHVLARGGRCGGGREPGARASWPHLAGLPEGAGGCFVSGGSAGNLSALMVARDTAGYRRGDRTARSGRSSPSARRPTPRWARRSTCSASSALAVPTRRPPPDRRRPCGARWRDDPRGDDVVGVVATAGHHQRRHRRRPRRAWRRWPRSAHLWFHVDGAYGGAAALFAPSVRHQFAGFERADSFIVDPHKWLFAPFDCAALLYRQPNLAKAVHTQDASLPRRPAHARTPRSGTRATTPTT